MISAFIKSMRGSDPDAAVYWLARMLEAGEDRPIHRQADGHLRQRGHRDGRPAGARRGDVGRPRRSSSSACPRRSSTWPRRSSTWRRRRRATAARSPSGRPGRTSPRGALGEVPAHLRDTDYRGAKVLGHGAGYEYPHDHDHDELGGWVGQQYLPDALVGRRWYRAEPPRPRAGDRGADGRTGHGRGRRAMSAG